MASIVLPYVFRLDMYFTLTYRLGVQLWSHDQQIEHCLLILQWLTKIKGRYIY